MISVYDFIEIHRQLLGIIQSGPEGEQSWSWFQRTELTTLEVLHQTLD